MLLQPDVEQESDLDQEQQEERRVKVIVHNDDVTPYDFVVLILQKIFQLPSYQAEHVTFVAHISGLAHVATLPLSEAQKKVGKAHFAAGLEGYPLRFTIEPE